MIKATIVTYGCQMNEADSARIKEILIAGGFTFVRDPDEADVILLNTCSVRRRAEEKVFGKLAHLSPMKRQRPGLVIGVVGCMGQSSADEIRSKAPFVDFVLPPHQHDKLAAILQERFADRLFAASGADLAPDSCPFVAHVAISRGCDNACAYCVVPSVRGREVCHPRDQIEAEVGTLAARGVLQIWLLGQNVNSWRHQEHDFADLVRGLAGAFPALRFRFTSPHPRDFSERLIATLAGCPNVARQVHLPLQSGSDRVLETMRRGYDLAHYLSRVELLRRYMPDVALSTDLICGFPGETDDDFEKTLEAVRSIGFDTAYTFYYSPRPGTAAANAPDQLPVAVRKDRLRRLIDLQLAVARERNQRLVGSVLEVLAERVAPRPPGHLLGRADSNRLVVFPGEPSLIGSYRRVTVVRADSVTVFGEPITD
ncbi:MAG: tRNA (N6-isopentenyl adenosine(37)-C2)-methylthiotransferase MiaB [Candidatus Riflebacteria bacterium]|nr:tRNA (N6-isopentenyl adenosine(37)-C2)-methylthiotransferase MiaB [Candidatus Riflebacteria bacterium]